MRVNTPKVIALAAVLALTTLYSTDAEARRWHRGWGWGGLAAGIATAAILGGGYYYPRRSYYYDDYPYYDYGYSYRPRYYSYRSYYRPRHGHRYHRHW